VTPGVTYLDGHAGIQWLEQTLGFRTAALFEDAGRVAYAQLVWQDGAIQVEGRHPKSRVPRTGPASVVLTAKDASDVDRYYERALAAKAEVIIPLEDTPFGNHGFSLRDPEGNLWHVGTPFLKIDSADKPSKQNQPTA
jgi:uncharacterized glyoxalase superfamily protein PhnB